MPFKNKLIAEFIEGTNEAILHEPLTYVDKKHGPITAHANFHTDFASVPGLVFLPGLVPKVGRVRKAAVIHDWIYRGQEKGRFTRKEADEIFHRAMHDCGMPSWRAHLAYAGVRIGGWASWNGEGG